YCLRMVLFMAALASGCARSIVSSTVHPDGSWTRKVVFHGAAAEGNGPSFGTKLEDAFTLPSGANWKIKREKKEEEVIVTAERAMQPGETLKKDVTLLTGKTQKTELLVNEVSVKQIAPGRFEYRETLR